MGRVTAPVRLPLNGADWQFKGFYGEDWRWRNAHKPGTRDVRHWHPASVPGSVVDDLWHQGLVPDPYFELNTLRAEWAADRTWLYKKIFTVDEALRGQRARLVFEGVDYDAQFFLNGELLGRHVGMYTPAVFDAGALLNYGGENLLAVVIEPAPHEQPQVGHTSRVRTHKARMNYWWDFCPRLLHQGLWQPVYLAITGPVLIDDLWVRPRLAASWQQAEVALRLTLSSDAARTAEVMTAVSLERRPVATHAARYALEAGQNTFEVTLTLDEPRLWWPNGHGRQPLYTVAVEVATRENAGAAPYAVSDERTADFGVRHLEFVPNEQAAHGARPYTLVANGKRVYLTGWNWVPLDVCYGVPRRPKLDRLLRLAQRAHVNLLRVWGGGLIETEAFYCRCDRLGLLVWQEFIQSSSGIDNNSPQDAGHIQMMVDEARVIVPRLRNHPALAVWCGGNELQAGPEQPLDDGHPLLAALKGVVRELDPGRHWLPTSPSGPVFGNSLENIAADPKSLHDVHGPWEHQGLREHFRLYNAGSSLLHSEFGVEGLTNRRTLDTVIEPSHQWPVTLDSPLWFHLGAWWLKAPRWREMFGEAEALPALHRAVQFLQADGLRYAIEANRRRQYQNGGSLPWQFNEPYPMAACTSAVDYYAQPKPAYYAVAAAYGPIHVSARFERQAWAGETRFAADVWAHNSTTQRLDNARVIAALRDLSGHPYREVQMPATLPADSATCLLVLDCELQLINAPMFMLDLGLVVANGRALARNRYLFSRTADLSPALAAPSTEIAAEVEPGDRGRRVAITNQGAQTALNVWLEPDRPVKAPGYAYFSDNYLCLLPGERREVTVEWTGAAPGERRLAISGWNTNEIRISA
jgi:beta-mannosidase